MKSRIPKPGFTFHMMSRLMRENTKAVRIMSFFTDFLLFDFFVVLVFVFLSLAAEKSALHPVVVGPHERIDR